MKHIIDTEQIEKLKRMNRNGEAIIYLDDLRALIANSPQADDMVLVPIEPTDEMLERIWQRSKVNELTDDAYEGVIKRNAAIDYKAMLSACKPQADDVRKDAWISVEDRLPEELSTILICDIQNEQYVALLNDGEFYQADVPNEILESITHWMPLPAPPLDKARE